MKKFLSTAYSEGAFNVASLALRLVFGLLICINHGFDKLAHFGKYEYSFADPFHIGHRWTLVLVIFAEVFCALMFVLGLLTRLAALILVIEFAVIVFIIDKGHNLHEHELTLTYLAAFFAVLLVGPGRFSVDGMMGK